MTENNVKQIKDAVGVLLQRRSCVTVAIDGRCASGKTTLAARLAASLPYPCNVFHMDDFFLRPEQRTVERLARAGENVDHERFLAEVLLPLATRQPFSYRPYDCHARSQTDPIEVTPAVVSIVEGSYACHPALWAHYDLHVLLDVAPDEQIARIVARNGEEAARVFRDVWIPLEEAYFAEVELAARCEIVLK